MKKSVKTIISIVAVVALIATLSVAFVACNKPGDENKYPNGVITIAYTDFAPMNYEDENGTLVGFDTELATKVFTKLGYKPVFKEVNWDQKYLLLASGTVDCLWNGFTSNANDADGKARSEKVDFTYAYMNNNQAIVVNKSNAKGKELLNATSKDDFKNTLGAFENGSAGETFLGTFANVNKKGCDSQIDALKDVKLGASQFAVCDLLLASAKCNKGDFKDLAIVKNVYSDQEKYAVGFEKGSPLVAKVNEQFTAMLANGEMQALAEKYGLTSALITDYSDQIPA